MTPQEDFELAVTQLAEEGFALDPQTIINLQDSKITLAELVQAIQTLNGPLCRYHEDQAKKHFDQIIRNMIAGLSPTSARRGPGQIRHISSQGSIKAIASLLQSIIEKTYALRDQLLENEPDFDQVATQLASLRGFSKVMDYTNLISKLEDEIRQSIFTLLGKQILTKEEAKPIWESMDLGDIPT